MTPEDLVRAFDTLDLADVYAAIAYYLPALGGVWVLTGARATGHFFQNIKIRSFGSRQNGVRVILFSKLLDRNEYRQLLLTPSPLQPIQSQEESGSILVSCRSGL